MSRTKDIELEDVLNWGAVGFGVVAAIAPRVFQSSYGLHDTAELRTMVRMWGTKTVALGVIGLRADSSEVRALAQVSAVMNLADALVVANAGPQVERTTRVLGALTSGGFAAAAAVVAGRD